MALGGFGNGGAIPLISQEGTGPCSGNTPRTPRDPRLEGDEAHFTHTGKLASAHPGKGSSSSDSNGISGAVKTGKIGSQGSSFR